MLIVYSESVNGCSEACKIRTRMFEANSCYLLVLRKRRCMLLDIFLHIGPTITNTITETQCPRSD